MRNKEIKSLEKQIDKLIKENFNEIYKNMHSIKGIGFKTAAGIILHLGDLSSFETYKQIIDFIGASPAINKSGNA